MIEDHGIMEQCSQPREMKIKHTERMVFQKSLKWKSHPQGPKGLRTSDPPGSSQGSWPPGICAPIVSKYYGGGGGAAGGGDDDEEEAHDEL